MILTIQQIIDSFDGELSKLFKDSLGKLDPTTEIIRKQLPASMLRFEEGETAMIGVISDLRKDRDDEVLLPEGMDDSNYSGVVLWQHDYWRQEVPHARSMYRQLNPRGNPYEVLAKTQYLTEISDLGSDVYEYRKLEHPLGQSIGFCKKEAVGRGQTGYDEVYKEWKPRVKAMLKEKEIKPTADEYTEPYRFFTKWELWEYSDVFIGSNPDALQVAVSKGVLSPEEAKLLVLFDAKGEAEEPDSIEALLGRLEKVEKEIERLKTEGFALRDGKFVIPTKLTESLSDMWGTVPVEKQDKSIQEMWGENTA